MLPRYVDCFSVCDVLWSTACDGLQLREITNQKVRQLEVGWQC